jgi:HKD family nuclease
MYTNESNSGNEFGKEIVKQLNDAEHVEIATGYFGWKNLTEITPQLLNIAKRGSSKLLFGMIFHERATPNQKNCLLELNKKLKDINNSSGVFVTLRPYHGKVYRFVKNNNETLFVGSSNLSISGFKQNMEFNLKISGLYEKQSTKEFLDFLFVGEGIKNNISCPLDEVDLKLKGDSDEDTIDEKSLGNYEIPRESFPTVQNDGFLKIKHRPSDQPRSSLNLYFDNGRKVVRNGRSVYTPRPWYEVEVTAQKKERDHKDYPKGEWIAYVHDEDQKKFYKLNMVTSSGDITSPKAIQTSRKEGGGRSILGELIKGKMERRGVLKKFQKITDEVLEEYGRDCIELKKISEAIYVMKV